MYPTCQLHTAHSQTLVVIVLIAESEGDNRVSSINQTEINSNLLAQFLRLGQPHECTECNIKCMNIFFSSFHMSSGISYSIMQSCSLSLSPTLSPFSIYLSSSFIHFPCPHKLEEEEKKCTTQYTQNHNTINQITHYEECMKNWVAIRDGLDSQIVSLIYVNVPENLDRNHEISDIVHRINKSRNMHCVSQANSWILSVLILITKIVNLWNRIKN